jgi:hypothetical protein
LPDSVTIQPNGQTQLKPWLGADSPAFNSLQISIQGNYFTKKNGLHLELAPGFQAAINGATSDSRFSISGFVQLTLAGLKKLSIFQLQPLAQIQFQKNFPGGSSLALGPGLQITADIVGEHFQWFAQGLLAGNLDLMNGGLSLSPLLAAGFLFKFDVPPNVPPPVIGH